MTASLRKMSAQAKGRLAPLDRVVVRDETGAVLLDMDGMDLRSYLVMATLDQVAVTLQTLISHGQLRPVAGQPWSFVATGEAQVAAWQASARLVRRRYAEDEAA